jgi:hypothetical protein
MPKINLPEDMKKLKSQLETSNSLVDYFLVCGVSPSICNESYLYDLNSQKDLENLKSKLKPKIISKFPEFDLSKDSIDEEIINYCFPKGFSPVYSYNGIEPKAFSVILDNNLFSSDYPQKYLTCLLFYEKVSQYKLLQLNIENRKPTDKEKDLLEDERKSVMSTIDNRKSGISMISVNSSEKRPTMDSKYFI